MGRIARIVMPHIPHHVTQRGNRRQQTFFCDKDYKEYLPFIGGSCESWGVEILAYCLMPNHIHLIAVPKESEALARAIGDGHLQYTRQVNRRMGWTGHLWQGRFFSVPLDDSHVLAAVRYIELNPVRAGLVKDPAEYPWSSAHAHIQGVDDLLVKSAALQGIVADWRDFLNG